VSDAATLASRSLRDESRRTALAALALAAACTVLFATLGHSLEAAEVLHADERAVAEVRQHAVASVSAVAHALSFVGSSQMLALVALTAVAVLLARRRPHDATLVVLALAGAEIINAVLKNAFERPRPSIHDPLETAAGLSFPSGHAMASMALFAALAFVLMRGRSARTRMAAVGVAATLVGAIGLSRIYLGVHFPTDVAAGWSAGLAWAAVSVLLLSLVRAVRTPAPLDRRRLRRLDQEAADSRISGRLTSRSTASGRSVEASASPSRALAASPTTR
jgi:undecaprenyl-diphosphatase